MNSTAQDKASCVITQGLHFLGPVQHSIDAYRHCRNDACVHTMHEVLYKWGEEREEKPRTGVEVHTDCAFAKRSCERRPCTGKEKSYHRFSVFFLFLFFKRRLLANS